MPHHNTNQFDLVANKPTSSSETNMGVCGSTNVKTLESDHPAFAAPHSFRNTERPGISPHHSTSNKHGSSKKLTQPSTSESGSLRGHMA